MHGEMRTAILVASGCRTMPVGARRTGVSLPQLGSVHAGFAAAGWQVRVASPHGGEVPLDAGTLSEQWMSAATLATGTEPLGDLAPRDADAWFVLGGHGVLVDLVDNSELRRLLEGVVGADVLLGALDHGVAALSQLTGTDGRPVLDGRVVTGRTDLEERDIRHHRFMPRSTEQLVRAAGARFSSTDAWRSHVVVDGRLVTAQNPASATPAVETVLRLDRPLAAAA